MNISLNFKTFGAGEPIIILHGLFGMLDNWKTFAKQLSEEFLVYILDQRDHGKSEKTNEFNYELLSDDLLQFMDDNGIYRAHIMGHSMGGKTAMTFANLNPERVNKLIIVDIGPKKLDGNHQAIFEAIMPINPVETSSRSEVQNQLLTKLQNQEVVFFLMKNLHRLKEGGYEWKANFPLLQKQYQEIMDATFFDMPYDGQTLFVRGAKSDYISDEDWPQILENYPNAILSTIQNAGHWVHAEQPQLLLKEVSTFLEN